MRFTVGVSRAGEQSYAWTVMDDETDDLLGDGVQPRWLDALTRATAVLANRLVEQYGLPDGDRVWPDG